MRVPSELPRRRRRRRGEPRSNRLRIAVIVVVAALVVLLLTARGIARFYTDYLWFDTLSQRKVFTGVLGAKIALVAIFTGGFFLVMFVNLTIGDRLAARYRLTSEPDEIVDRYQALVRGKLVLVRAAVSLLFALIAGVAVSGQWRDWLLFTHGVKFGVKDELFNRDVGFYVFQLPFLTFLVSWLFAALVIVFVVTAVNHYVNGGIRIQGSGPRVTATVKAHLSLLLGALALLKAVGYYLQRFELTVSTRGTVDGATYTDVRAQLPAINLLILISLLAFVLLVLNIWRRGWVLPILSVGLWALVAVVAGAIYPAFIQRFLVQPAESTREADYISRNVNATRRALNLNVKRVNVSYKDDVDSAKLENAKAELVDTRLLDPKLLGNTFQQLQAAATYYRFNTLDTDRYTIDGKATQVLVSARELNANELPQRSWEGRTLIYTHGFGAAIAPANRTTTNGQPAFQSLGSDGPTSLQVSQGAIYFGESLPKYAVVASRRTEVGLAQAGEAANPRYAGAGGVPMGSLLRRAAFALRFGDQNLLISSQITSKSRILYLRDVKDRVKALAPFLDFDANPYLVVNDGKLVWVIDGYTTTDRYPYAQRAQTSDVSGDLHERLNYVRNSVKAVVDAYDGTVKFYIADPSDPIVRAWAKAFPSLFTANDKIPAALAAHFRYPEDLFRIQTTMWARYQIDDPKDFYQFKDAFRVAQDPGNTQAGGSTTPTSVLPSGATTGGDLQRVDPYYALMHLPGSEQSQFVEVRSFVPFSENDSLKYLRAYMVAGSDPGHYGELTAFVFRASDQPPGPARVQEIVQSNPQISQQLTLLDQQGSAVKFGDVQIMPIGTSMLYIRPLYVEAKGQTAVPRLARVLAVYNNRAFIGNSLSDVLKQMFGSSPELGATGTSGGGDGSAPSNGGTDTTPTTTTTTPSSSVPSGSSSTTVPSTGTETVDQLLAEASDLYDQAQKLPASDLGKYQDLIAQAFAKVKQAAALQAAGQGTGTGGTGTGGTGTGGTGSPTTTVASATSSVAPATTVADPGATSTTVSA